MSAIQRAGLIFAGGAGLLWVAVVLLFLATPRGAGANIGAGMLALVASAVSVVAAVLLVRAGLGRDVKVAGGISLAAWVIFFAIPVYNTALGFAKLGFVGLAVVALFVCSALTLRRRPLER